MTIINNKSQSENVIEVGDISQGLDVVAEIGAQLKYAREIKKISVSEVAAKLKLTKSVIDNLEVDAWDKFNGRTYARGYLTSYANFLGLSAADLLAQYDEGHQEEFQPLKVHRNHVTKRGFRWFKFVLLVLIGLAAWFAVQQWPEVKAKFMTQMADLKVDETILSKEREATTLLNTETMATPQMLEIEEASQMIETTTSEVIDNDQVTTLKLPDLMEKTPVMDTDSTVENTEISDVNEIVEAAQPIDPMLATLALAFGGTCWVSVKDAVGVTLMNDTKQVGEHIVLTGQPPLQIVLGDASNVKVRFNGTSFNTQPFTNRTGVARFTLNNKQL